MDLKEQLVKYRKDILKQHKQDLTDSSISYCAEYAQLENLKLLLEHKQDLTNDNIRYCANCAKLENLKSKRAFTSSPFNRPLSIKKSLGNVACARL